MLLSSKILVKIYFVVIKLVIIKRLTSSIIIELGFNLKLTRS